MRQSVWIVAFTLFTSSVQAEDRRQAAAHEHGHGSLDIAIEGNTVAMALRAPGADIVGFEHAAENDADKAALADAIAKLEKPLALFVPPAAANCTVVRAEVEFEVEHGDEKHDADLKDRDKSAKHEDDGDRREAGRAEFHAEYSLSCANVAALDHFAFAYFERFPAAEELEVQIITEKGQTGGAVTRAAPGLDLAGMI